MSAHAVPTSAKATLDPASRRATSAPRLWPAVVLLAIFWAAQIVVGRLEMPYFFRFMSGMAVPALLVLLYSIWWWTNRRIALKDRFAGFLAVPLGGAIVAPLCHPSIWFSLPFSGLPMALTVGTAWLLVVKWTGFTWPRLGALVLLALAWASFTTVRNDGVNSDLKPALAWRWSPTAEQRFLVERASADESASTGTATAADWHPVVTAADWPSFRGPQRDGTIPGVTIATEWNTSPPKQLWRQRVGPAWSSVIVVGDRLFTQEQRGEQEAVVCYDATTGQQIWVRQDPVRFWEAVSGAGPRATPTYDDGRIYTLGAKGRLNCLDAATGQVRWSRDAAAEAEAKPPMWGYSGSPLVTDGAVIVFAGGEGKKNLLAYRAATGEPAWTAPAGPLSYASPQLATIAGQRQCLLVDDRGLISVDPANGATLWEHVVEMRGAPRCLQAHLIGDSQLLVGNLSFSGVALLDVARDGGAWKATQRWASGDLKPEFSDVVVHQGHAYGFDVSVFACIDLATGKRAWKGGRYGRGQVMLLPEQSVLLVLSETGEAVLVAAKPDRHEELARFQALNGKTWNHPVIAHGRLYVRNAEEMACYELATK